LLMVLVTGSVRGMRSVFQYGHAHASPNSGYPEAALAGILGCRFGGPNVYHGVTVEKPFIGLEDRIITDKDFSYVKYINHAVALLTVTGIVLAI
jgi:adenosylcobinamide-phosphate synthase